MKNKKMTNPEKEKAFENPETKAFVELFRKYPEAVAYLLKGFICLEKEIAKGDCKNER